MNGSRFYLYFNFRVQGILISFNIAYSSCLYTLHIALLHIGNCNCSMALTKHKLVSTAITNHNPILWSSEYGYGSAVFIEAYVVWVRIVRLIILFPNDLIYHLAQKYIFHHQFLQAHLYFQVPSKLFNIKGGCCTAVNLTHWCCTVMLL